MEFLTPIFDKLVAELSTTCITQHTNNDGDFYFLINSHGTSVYPNQEPWILFDQIDEEISDNISMPETKNTKIGFINKLVNILSAIEAKIELEDSIWLPVDIVIEQDVKDSITQYYRDEISLFFLEIKKALRKKISKLTLLSENFSSPKGQRMVDLGLIWERDKTDLIELVRALVLCKAIKTQDKTLNLIESYDLFGELFNTELKNPEDQLRQRAETFDKPVFLEELLSKYMEDQKILKRKRDSKTSSKNKS